MLPNPITQGIGWIPLNATWEDWNGNMVHYFGEEPIPYIPHEEEWKTVAMAVIGLPTFSVYSPPSPDLYNNWQDWALAFRTAVNGSTI